ncbi:MAG: ABC transporter permease [Anaerolineaceae bacterium]|nr:ABC transporter permease [Anaerolineaceae bacterium]
MTPEEPATATVATNQWEARGRSLLLRSWPVLRVLLTLLLALLLGGIIMEISGKDSIAAYRLLYREAVGGQRQFANTLLKATPLIFTGLATMVAFRAGIFNVGVEGSLYVGAFGAAWVGFTFTNLPAIPLIALCFAFAALVGGLWGVIPGYLKARWAVDEIVTTIMLNYVAIFFTDYLVNGPFYLPGMANAMSERVAPQAELPRFIRSSQWNPAFFLAIAAFIAVLFLMRRLTLGYEIRALGSNLQFSRWSSMPILRIIVLVMFISGALGGLAGGGQALGVHYRFVSGFSRGLGYDGIVIALVGRNHPVGVLLAALFFGALRSGSTVMEIFTDVPRDLVDVIQALIILFIAIDLSFTWWRRWRARRQESETAELQVA